ncbi:hypothetical protein MSAN_00089800 [Mycena sanguinolenta]|uniref:Uncharacterized protein n=1 Tax=Mycena sanguinolenta TaxID=230812 RepID=A0A8H6ZH11_9AGAR|nr:hypothetical protein MSAN_00089800 [Mycena sanguinolenta]
MPLTPGTKESYLGAFLECIIYGFYLSTFIECCILFRRNERRKDMKQTYVIFTAVVMFVFITVRCIIDTYRCVAAFDITDPNGDFGLGDPNTTLDLVTNAFWFFLTPFADAFIIFRTFHVWNRNWFVIILPVLLCLANIGSSIWVMIALANLETGLGPTLWGNIVFKSLNLFLSLTLCTNIVCTAFISFRIMRIHREITLLSSSLTPTYTVRAISIIVESAAIYTLVLVGALVSNRANSFVNFAFFDCTPPTIGLVFSYIIIRVSRGTACENHLTSSTFPSRSMRFRPRDAHPELNTQAYELDRNPGVQVHLDHETGTNGTRASGNYGSQSAAKHAEIMV